MQQITEKQYKLLSDEIYTMLMGAEIACECGETTSFGMGEMGEVRDGANTVIDQWLEKAGIELVSSKTILYYIDTVDMFGDAIIELKSTEVVNFNRGDEAPDYRDIAPDQLNEIGALTGSHAEDADRGKPLLTKDRVTKMLKDNIYPDTFCLWEDDLQDREIVTKIPPITFREALKETYCVVGKCDRNKLPHIISCSIGIKGKRLAEGYALDMATNKQVNDQRKNEYQWTKAMKLDDAINDSEILLCPTDKYFLSQEYKPIIK